MLRESNYQSITWAPAQPRNEAWEERELSGVWADHMECLHSSRARSLTIPQMPSKWHKTNDMPRDEHQLTQLGGRGSGRGRRSRGQAGEFKWKRRSSINVRLSVAHVIIIKLTRQRMAPGGWDGNGNGQEDEHEHEDEASNDKTPGRKAYPTVLCVRIQMIFVLSQRSSRKNVINIVWYKEELEYGVVYLVGDAFTHTHTQPHLFIPSTCHNFRCILSGKMNIGIVAHKWDKLSPREFLQLQELASCK